MNRRHDPLRQSHDGNVTVDYALAIVAGRQAQARGVRQAISALGRLFRRDHTRA